MKSEADFGFVVEDKLLKSIYLDVLYVRKYKANRYSVQCRPIYQVLDCRMILHFRKTGLDFAGTLYVKEIYNKNSDMFKAYICLFTCATTRNVHLELTPGMDAGSLIRCIKRFISRRGVVRAYDTLFHVGGLRKNKNSNNAPPPPPTMVGGGEENFRK